ncbi:hypothetical protein [uncultured Fusobacterium sp.]|uniref:hypothetical protein n=1 Tax=uncultured Fusobacterium sp. TaxID=159267 RepID=UPI0025EE5FC0|nr:hypothetical protein [uncultured Fusobacterium sp.]
MEVFLKMILISCVFGLYFIFYQILRLTLFDVTDLSVKSAGIIGAIIVIIVFCLSIFLAFKL